MRGFLWAIAALSPIACWGSLAAAASPNQATPTSASSAAPMTAEQLADVSGGESEVVNALSTQTLSAAVTGNQINAGTIQSGAVSFQNGAFSGFNGVGNFVINTGNNNVLQGSLSVTVVPLH